MSAEGIRRSFGPNQVLRDVSLEVAWGEAVAILGANGVGKSTFLRIAAGALRPSAGDIRAGGECLRGRPDALRASTALLAGDSFLYDDLTARENLAFAARMSARDVSSDRLDEALESVGLARVAGSRVRHFSSGMRKRLALARVVAMDPPILLLDEPYASLDEDAMALVDGIVARWRTEGRSVVMATHLRDRAVGVCDRIVRLVDGVLIAGTPWLGAARPRLVEAAP